MNSQSKTKGLTAEPFGWMNNKQIMLYTLGNDQGIKIRISNLGGIVQSLFVPDSNGEIRDIVLGYEQAESYFDDPHYHGAIVGRVCNRIAGGRFTINDREYRLARNLGDNHLHGGVNGFSRVLWDVVDDRSSETNLVLKYHSPDMEEGYPGNLEVETEYFLQDRSLKITYRASTDKSTPCNLTNHAYFNLNGAGYGDILDHVLKLNADSYTPTDHLQIPTGEIRPVRGTSLDFREPKTIGERIDNEDEQLKIGHGYDHNFVVNGESGKLNDVAEVKSDASGIGMKVYSTEAGVQLYTGNFLGGETGKYGKIHYARHGFCLETQHFPDAPNHPEFPSIILEPGRNLFSQTVYEFMF